MLGLYFIKKDTFSYLNVLNRGKVNSGAGELTIRNGVMNDLSMDIGVGELELTGKLTGNCIVDYGIGETNHILTWRATENVCPFCVLCYDNIPNVNGMVF